ncbi:hypothetical protein Lser_V15G40570 [Lactuca serriola]
MSLKSTRLQEEGVGVVGGRGSNSLKQTTLDASNMFRRSERSASVAASASIESIAVDEENLDSDSADEPVKLGLN